MFVHRLLGECVVLWGEREQASFTYVRVTHVIGMQPRWLVASCFFVETVSLRLKEKYIMTSRHKPFWKLNYLHIYDHH